MSDAIRELSVAIDFNDIDLSRLLRMDRAIDSVERSVRDLGGDLNRLGTRADEAGAEGSRAMDRLERHTDGAGDAMDELGRDAARAGDRTERAARDAAQDIDRLGREADNAMDEMRNGAGRASDAIRDAGQQGDRAADDIRASSDRAADALRDMGNAGERAAGDIIRAGGRADSELDSIGGAARRARDAMDELARQSSDLTRLTRVMNNIGQSIAAQERRADALREALDQALDQPSRTRIEAQIRQAESAMNGLTRQADRTTREIDQLEQAMRETADRASRAGREAGDAMDEIRRSAGRAEDAMDELGDASRRAGENGAQGGGKLLDMLNDVIPQGRAAGAASILFSNPWVAAGVAIVAAIGGIGVAIAGMVNEAESNFKRLQAQLGYTEAQMSGVKGTVLDVYEQGFGESLRDVGDNVAVLKQGFKDLDDEGIAGLAKGAYTLKDLFGPEVKETSKAIKTMTNNFKDLSEQDALDLLTTGFQKGGDYADDFIDTVNEYSGYFDKLGVSAEQFVGTLIRGGEEGAFNLDKVGDSFKELGIRAIDGSDTTKDAFNKLGFDADKMGANFAAGGDTAHQALMATVSALSFVEDAQERNRLGVELFGTQWEDMRENVIFSIDGAEKAVEGFEGATERATETMQDTVGTKWSQITRQFKTGFIEAFDGGGGAMTDLLDKVLTFMPQVQEAIGQFADWISGFFTENKAAFDQFGGGLISTFSGVWETLKGIWNIIGPTLTAVFSGALGIVLSSAGHILTLIGDVFSIFGKVLQGDWSGAWTAIKDFFSDSINGILNVGETVLNALFGVFDSVWGRIIEFVWGIDLTEAGKNIIDGLMNGVRSMKDMAVNAIKDVGKSMLDGIKGFFGIHSPSTVFAEIGSFLIDGLRNGIKNMGSKAVDSIKDVASNIWGGVKDFFGIHSPSRLMAEAGGFIVEGLTVGIDSTAMDAVAAAKDLSEGIEAASTIKPIETNLAASDAVMEIDRPEPLTIAAPELEPLKVEMPELPALDVNMPELPKVQDTPEVSAIVQPEPQRQPEAPQTAQGFGVAQQQPTTGLNVPQGTTGPNQPPIQVTFGDVIVQLPEGSQATQQEAQGFGDEIARRVKQELTAFFKQMGIVYGG